MSTEYWCYTGVDDLISREKVEVCDINGSHWRLSFKSQTGSRTFSCTLAEQTCGIKCWLKYKGVCYKKCEIDN